MDQAPIPLSFGTTAIPASGTLTSNIVSINQQYGYAVQLFWTGSPVGMWQIQGSNDVGFIHPDGSITGVTHLTPDPNSAVNITGTAGSTIINLNGQFYRWFNVIYTATSGTGTLTFAQANIKG